MHGGGIMDGIPTTMSSDDDWPCDPSRCGPRHVGRYRYRERCAYGAHRARRQAGTLPCNHPLNSCSDVTFSPD